MPAVYFTQRQELNIDLTPLLAAHLAATVHDNPGMRSVELDVTDPTNIAAVAKKLIAEFPKLNVLINNAGIMMPDNAAGAMDEELLVSTVTTNLLGPIL
jgi:uncharacterized oxidoreductase